jgi:endonuclease/exonuclease/phosphatase (EEP) superfamily protein YafD
MCRMFLNLNRQTRLRLVEIDWILYRGAVNVLHYKEIVDGVYPSDHNPIYVEFEL